MSSPSLTNKRQRAQQRIQVAGYFGIPELKNPRYLACFKDGRHAHLKAWLADPLTSNTDPHAHLKAWLADPLTSNTDPQAIPLYSHHATRQSLFAKGWQSVTELDRLRARARRSQPQEKETHHA